MDACDTARLGDRHSPHAQARPLFAPHQQRVRGLIECGAGEVVAAPAGIAWGARPAGLVARRRQAKWGPTWRDRLNRSGPSIVAHHATANRPPRTEACHQRDDTSRIKKTDRRSLTSTSPISEGSQLTSMDWAASLRHQRTPAICPSASGCAERRTQPGIEHGRTC